MHVSERRPPVADVGQVAGDSDADQRPEGTAKSDAANVFQRHVASAWNTVGPMCRRLAAR